MEHYLARYWWTLALRGVLAILFGVLTFIWPLGTWFAITVLFAVWFLLDGIAALAAVFGGGGGTAPRWALLLEGVVGIGVALWMFLNPLPALEVPLVVMAFWAVATGVFEIVAAVHLRAVLRNEFWLILSGALSVLFGLALMSWPAVGIMAVTWLIGFYAILFGVSMLALSFRLRNWGHGVRPAGGAL